MLRKFDRSLLVGLAVVLVIYYLNFIPKAIGLYVLFGFSLIGTIPVIVSAVKSLKEKKISVDLLASIALVVSLIVGEWASAAFINLMLTSARIFADYTDSKARTAIKSLLKLRPDKVKIKKDGKIIEIPVSKVLAGDSIVVESGGRIAIDGVVEEGEASVDQSSLTGESIPVNKAKNDEVYSSTLAVAGSLVVKATKVGENTTLEKIIKMVESSQREKAGIRTTADKFATWYIVITLIGSIVVYFTLKDLNLLLSLLLVACADDIAIAVPLAFLAGIGYAARRGILIKGSIYLEGLSRIKTMIFDKTGTITLGKLAVKDFKIFNGFSKNDLFSLAGVAESVSSHPIAKSISRYVAESKIFFTNPDNFKEYPGKGIVAEYKGKEIISGRVNFVKERGAEVSSEEDREIKNSQNNGYTVTLVSLDKKLVGFFSSADQIRPNVKSIIEKIKELGVERVIMLTGDNEAVAKKISDEAGISEYHANLMPEDKVAYLKKNIAADKKLAMVGDGVNDAASLALADIGIAMGTIGSDTAIEAADIALMKDKLAEIPEAIKLSRYVRKIAGQDFWIWAIVNAFGLVLVFAKVLGPEGASAFNFITDFFPLLNSIRLFSLRLNLS